jgi:hypothetical protein
MMFKKFKPKELSYLLGKSRPFPPVEKRRATEEEILWI